MNQIDYQSLRKAAQNYQSTLAWYQEKPDSPNAERDCDAALAAFKREIHHREVDIIAGLLDELDEKQQYIKLRDQENEDIALTVGKLRVELEETKSKLNEQREYYEGVISDGGKRIAELEKSEEQLINERDHAESALDDMYFAATGNRPEWSNWFG
ncbi:ead/Ea22-like family protein, partial [Escherichia coli]